MRGRPFTPHWFVIHDDQGRINPWQTHERGGLPRSDVELASLIRGMMDAAGCPSLYGIQDKFWYMWDGSGRYTAQRVSFPIRMTKDCAGWVQQAFNDIWNDVTERIRLRVPEARRERELKNAADVWRPHKMFAAKIWNDAGQTAIRKQIQEQCAEDRELFDRMTGKIVVDNGVIELSQIQRDGYVVLQPHDPHELITKRMGTGVYWDPHAVCPVFERFMREVVPDDEQRHWLLWRTAHTLFGSQPRKGFVNLIGETNSGKSTFTDLIAHLAGDYARSVQVETFLAKARGDQGFRQHELMGARFVHTHEPNAIDTYDVSFMKTITGRDEQSTRTLNQGFIRWKPQCTPFIGSNNPIRFNTSDDAMVQRQEAVQFVRGYSHRDDSIQDRMRAELPGILALLMRLVAWDPDDIPFSMMELRERMATITEPALQFIAEWLDEGRLYTSSDVPLYQCAQVSRLYQHYSAWCLGEAGVKPVGRNVFGAIVGRKYPVRHSNGHRFMGLVTR